MGWGCGGRVGGFAARWWFEVAAVGWYELREV